MGQLPLNFINRLNYSSDSFLPHSGVKDSFEYCIKLASQENFGIACIQGAARTGKTHLAVALSHRLSEHGFDANFVSAREYGTVEAVGSLAENVGALDVLIIDDADELFDKLGDEVSGAFVNLVEAFRVQKACIFLFFAGDPTLLACDDHVLSRLRPGLGHILSDPDESELQSITRSLAKQRGIHLSDKKLQYIEKRVGRSIQEQEDYLNRVSYLSQLMGRSVKFPLLSEAL